MTYLKNFKKYHYLLTILVKKDIKKKYKDSVLGILWSLLNPMLNMIIITIVFSTLFNRHIDNFPVYVLSGMMTFEFFSSGTNSSMNSIITSANLIKKVYIPKYIFTLSKTISSFIFFLVSLIVLAIIMLFTKANVNLNLLYAPIYLLLLFIFTCGISLILSTIIVFFRDIEHLYGVFVRALMYASAIFYPAEIIPPKYQFILTLNPIYHFIEGFRFAVYYGLPLNYKNLLICFVIASISMIVGILVFEKNQDKFILHI
ncbi:MAG: ABC transporter [Desulfotomaculum sp. BICA1-6]|nr:MAG: ABC transporter [Desulfotomaculum sp. BICA1-6]